MKAKSDENIIAAQYLLNNCTDDMSNTSVHCSYYGAFQYVKYALACLCKYPISYTDQSNVPQGFKNGSHEYLYYLLEMSIKQSGISNPKYEITELNNRLEKLKSARNKADYSQQKVGRKESYKCLQVAQDVITRLNRIFP